MDQATLVLASHIAHKVVCFKDAFCFPKWYTKYRSNLIGNTANTSLKYFDHEKGLKESWQTHELETPPLLPRQVRALNADSQQRTHPRLSSTSQIPPKAKRPLPMVSSPRSSGLPHVRLMASMKWLALEQEPPLRAWLPVSRAGTRVPRASASKSESAKQQPASTLWWI